MSHCRPAPARSGLKVAGAGVPYWLSRTLCGLRRAGPRSGLHVPCCSWMQQPSLQVSHDAGKQSNRHGQTAHMQRMSQGVLPA